MAGPTMKQLDLLIQAGINPKTGLPIKMSDLGGFNNSTLSDDIRKQLRVLDEQNAVNRYVWYNLPSGLNGQLLERILYYKGQAAFFYVPANKKFYFLPYSLNGNIDIYGRYTGITPLVFGGGVKTADGKEKIKPFIQDMVKKPIYGLSDDLEDIENGAVILQDYTPQLSETIVSRQILQDPLLTTMAQTIPMAQTSLLANSGVKGVRVQDEGQAESVRIASREIVKSALSGNPIIPIVGSTEFQDLTSGSTMTCQEYLVFLQALDNYRLSLYGLENGGLFQKKSQMLEAEQEMNNQHAKLAFQDGLTRRQEFCRIVNSIWDLGIWCEGSTAAIGLQLTDEMETEEGTAQPMAAAEGENNG